MTDRLRTTAALFCLAVIVTVAGSTVVGCSPLDDSQTFDPADTASASTSVLGPGGN